MQAALVGHMVLGVSNKLGDAMEELGRSTSDLPKNTERGEQLANVRSDVKRSIRGVVPQCGKCFPTIIRMTQALLLEVL
jgi:hypothetical protein